MRLLSFHLAAWDACKPGAKKGEGSVEKGRFSLSYGQTKRCLCASFVLPPWLRWRQCVRFLICYIFGRRPKGEGHGPSGPMVNTPVVLATNQPQYLHDLISVQPCHNTHYLSMVTLARPPNRSSLKTTNCSLRYAPCLWNELHTDLREPRQIQIQALHFHLTHMAVYHLHHYSVFHSELKTGLFGKSFLVGVYTLSFHESDWLAAFLNTTKQFYGKEESRPHAFLKTPKRWSQSAR